MEQTKHQLIEEISKMSRPSKYIRDFEASEEVMPDLILVSPRHLFRMPYSLHEKTALASIVLSKKELADFDLKNANPMTAKVKNFTPDVKEGEAKELLVQALDWYKSNVDSKEPKSEERKEYKQIKLTNLSDKFFPPSIQKILQGIADGKKRALFVLLNFFRSVGMEKDELEKRIFSWNAKNKPPLKDGYLKAQLIWAYRNKVVLPPNFDKDYYKGIGVIPTDEEIRLKNPVTYVVKKHFANIENKGNMRKNKDNFKK